MLYKHNQLKDIKTISQNNPKVLCSLSLAVIWGLLLSRQSLRNKTLEKILKKKKTSNKRQA